MAAAFQLVKNTWDTINSSGQYMGLFLVAFIFLFIVETRVNRVLFTYSLIALVLLINPFTVNNLITFWPSFAEYWYAFLLLPVIPICAYVCVQAITVQKQVLNKWIVFCSFTLIAAIAGTLMNGTEHLTKVENRAGISNEALELIQAMNVPNEPVIVCADDEVLESIRAYTNIIIEPYEVTLINQSEELASSFYSPQLILLHKYMQEPENSLGGIVTLSRGTNCNYLVLPYVADDRDAMTSGGYEVLLETDNYVLYHDTGVVE